MLRRLASLIVILTPVSLAATGASGQTMLFDDQPADVLGSGMEFAEPAAEMAAPTISTEVVATPVSAAQPVATYDTRSGTWLPSCDATSNEWMKELEIPPHLINCDCHGKTPGQRCQVWRSFVKPTDPRIDPRCVVCVKEPCLGYDTVEETLHAVVYRCFETSEPFKHEGCEGGRWFESKGTTRVRKLHSCEVKVPIKYQKPVIKYRDVYYYIQCDKH